MRELHSVELLALEKARFLPGRKSGLKLSILKTRASGHPTQLIKLTPTDVPVIDNVRLVRGGSVNVVRH